MPRKVFVSGEILTAADVNTNLMDQSVMVFADSAARGSAIPTPAEGMVTYLSNINQVQAFTGAAFTPVGEILQVVSIVKTDTFTTSSTSLVDITGFSATITPKATSSKILVSVVIHGSADGAGTAPKFVLFRGATQIGGGTVVGSRTSAIGSLFTGSGIDTSQAVATFQFLDSPSTTSAQTYKVQTRVQIDTMFINRPATDADNAQARNSRLSSTITLVEVAG